MPPVRWGHLSAISLGTFLGLIFSSCFGVLACHRPFPVIETPRDPAVWAWIQVAVVDACGRPVPSVVVIVKEGPHEWHYATGWTGVDGTVSIQAQAHRAYRLRIVSPSSGEKHYLIWLDQTKPLKAYLPLCP